MAVHRGVARNRDRYGEHDGMRQVTMNSQILPLKSELAQTPGGSPKSAVTVAEVRQGRQPCKAGHRAPEQRRQPLLADLNPNTRWRPPEASPTNNSSPRQTLPHAAQQPVHKKVQRWGGPDLAVLSQVHAWRIGDHRRTHMTRAR